MENLEQLINVDYYTPLKDLISKYLKFGTKGDKSIDDTVNLFYKINLPDDIDVIVIPSYEAKLSKLHATASYELSMAECALSLADAMYDDALNENMTAAKTTFLGKREPGADKLKSIALSNLDPKYTLQKLYAESAVTVMKKVLLHLDFIASRLRNCVEASKVDARLEKGVM
jgi:hypothetical protein